MSRFWIPARPPHTGSSYFGPLSRKFAIRGINKIAIAPDKYFSELPIPRQVLRGVISMNQNALPGSGLRPVHVIKRSDFPKVGSID